MKHLIIWHPADEPATKQYLAIEHDWYDTIKRIVDEEGFKTNTCALWKFIEEQSSATYPCYTITTEESFEEWATNFFETKTTLN